MASGVSGKVLTQCATHTYQTFCKEKNLHSSMMVKAKELLARANQCNGPKALKDKVTQCAFDCSAASSSSTVIPPLLQLTHCVIALERRSVNTQNNG